jgi:UPF0755 protein
VIRRLLIGSVLALVVVGGGLAALLFLPGPKRSGTTTVSVAEGARFRDVAERLHAARLLRHPLPLVLWARLTGEDRRIGWGEYTLRSPIRPVDILAQLVGPPDPVHRVTVPEGLTVRETVALLVAHGLGSEDSFHCVLTDPRFLYELALPPEGAEGYLFPDTYTFPRTMSAERILRVFVRRFGAQFDASLAARARALGQTVQQTVTLASLIEEETQIADERQLVSAVFHNRLRRGMRLQSDPTVLYGRVDDDRRITRRDLRTPTPHNTYVIGGLPPTPIANPGRASLMAAADPAPVDYLYFVARGDGSHVFSTTLAAHEVAVTRYQRNRKASSAGAASAER